MTEPAYRIRNWERFQHYKDRRPPWIKLHKSLLDDMEYNLLSDKAGKNLPLIWLLASEDNNGILPPAKDAAFRLRVTRSEYESIISELVEAAHVEITYLSPRDGVHDLRQKNGFGTRYIKKSVKDAVMKRDRGKCCHCGSTKRLEFDHIVPVSAGGNGELSNVQLLCRSCNRSKRVSSQAEHLATQNQNLRSLETETEREGETERESLSKKAGS